MIKQWKLFMMKTGNQMFHNITDAEIRAKKMIAKFAILSNNYVGYLLKNYFSPKHIIFRNCNFENHSTMKSMTSFKEFIEYIVENEYRPIMTIINQIMTY